MADFVVIKERVSIEEVAEALKLTLAKSGAQLRGECKACGTGGPRALVITPSKGLFYCFSQGIGGDLISLWGHIQKCSLADAGRQIEAAFGLGTVTSERVNRTPVTVPDTPPAPAQTGMKALDYLEPEHPSVLAAGFDTEEAAKLGIGYASKGIQRGLVAIPVFDFEAAIAAGIPLRGYIGGTEFRCPPKGFFPTNVVPLQKRA